MWGSTRTPPEVGGWCPAMTRASVLLPEPEDPTSAVVVPGSMRSVTPLMPRPLVGYR